MTTCRSCGETLWPDGRFCPGCGLLVERLETVTSSTDRSLLWPVAALGVLAAVSLVLWSWPGDDGTESAEPTAPATSERPTNELLAELEPLPDLPAGLTMLTGRRGDLKALDLSTGQLTDLGLEGQPHLVSGDWLVLSGSGFSLRAVPVDDLSAEGTVLVPTGDGRWDGRVSPGPEPGQTWLQLSTDEEPHWYLVRLADGMVLDEIQHGLPANRRYDGPPLVVSSPAGGTFALRDGEYEKLSDGVPLAANLEHVIVHICSLPGECELQWFDLATGEPIDRPVPPHEIFAEGQLSPDGGLLTYFAWRSQDNPGYRVFEIDTERVIEVEQDPQDRYRLQNGPTFTAGERFVLWSGGREPIIADVETGEVHELTGRELAGSPAVLVESG